MSVVAPHAPRRAAVTVVTAVVLAAALGVISLRGERSAAERQLAATSDFVAAAPTVSAAIKVTTTQVSDKGEAATTSTYDVDFAPSGRSLWQVREGSEAVETIFLPAGNYQRGSSGAKDLSAIPFIFTAADDDGGVVASAANFLTVAPPTAADAQRTLGWLIAERLPSLLDRLGSKATLAAAGHVSGKVALGDVFGGVADLDEELAGSLLAVDVFSGDDGRLDRLVLGWDHRSEFARHVRTVVDATFDGWDEPLAISAPDSGQIDLTPQIDEAAVAAASQKAGVTLLAPASLPASFELASAKVDERPDGCFSVALNYVDTAAAEYSYLDLRLAPPTCGDPVSVVGSTMPAATVDHVMGSLQPLDWATQPIVARPAPKA